MAGMLQFGVMKGIGGEYLKQSEETRQAGFQEVRDRRLAELTTKENIRSEGVRAGEDQKERDFRSAEAVTKRESDDARAQSDRESREKVAGMEGDYTLSQGQRRYDADGKLIAEGAEKTFAPTSASLEAAKQVYRRAPNGERGAPVTYEELTNEWVEQAYIDTVSTDDLGNQIKTKKRNPNFPSLIDYQNQGVTDEFQLEPNDPKMLQRDPGKLWNFYQSQPEFSQPGGQQMALEAMKQIHPWWGPEMEGGAGYLGQAQSAAERTTQQGTLVDSPDDIQRQIASLENQMKTANGTEREQLQQQIGQYKALLER